MNNEQYLEADRADFDAYVASQLNGWTDPLRAEVEGFLRAYPGSSVRDWKGKGCDAPMPAQADEAAWLDLDPNEVRHRAIATVARLLTRNIRQAAGRDPSLIWNPLARKYRLRLASEDGRADAGQGEGTGRDAATPYGSPEAAEQSAVMAPTPGEKVTCLVPWRPALASGRNSNTISAVPRGRARRARGIDGGVA